MFSSTDIRVEADTALESWVARQAPSIPQGLLCWLSPGGFKVSSGSLN